MTNSEEYGLRFSSGRVVRISVLAIAAMMCFGLLSGFVGNVRASAGLLNPPHFDFGNDTDLPPNGLWNELVVNVGVDVTVAGMFIIIGELYDNSGTILIEQQFAMPVLPLGLQVAPLTYTGHIIRSSGLDGPYQVDLYLLDDMGMFLDMGVHMTGAHLATDFDAPPAYLAPPHSEYTLDNDGDLLHDYLVISTSLVVNTSGDYRVEGTLFDVTGMFWIDFENNYSSLGTGPQTVDIAYLGYIIRMSGIDGPYRVELELYDDNWNFLHNDTYFTGAYLATDFETPPARFSPPYTDYGLDTNINGIFEYLIVSTVVDVDVDGDYSVEGFSFIVGTAQNRTYLTAGIHVVDLRFYGYEIFISGIDGPYTINLELYDESWSLIDTDTHDTAAYLFTDFEPNPPCVFTSPHWDYGLDTDGDGDFNYLVVNANVTVGIAGFYELWADLWDQMGMIWITDLMNYTWLDVGAQTVDFLLPGTDIYQSGIDGPYWVDLYVFDEFNYFLDSDGFQTNPYLFTDFDPPPAYFSPPHSDYGLDTDLPPDGVYNFLVVDASITVNDPGIYGVNGALFDSGFNFITTAMEIANLTAGPQTVDLEFSGLDINRFGVDGPYIAMMALFEQGMGAQIDIDTHMTGPYNYADFTSLPISTLWGYVYRASDGTPVDSADVLISNYTHQYLDQTMTNATGYYEFDDAFDGDFYVGFDEANLQADIAFITMVGSTQLDAVLLDPLPNVNSVSIIWTDWDNADLSANNVGQHDNATTRLMIDVMVGNQDGFVNQTELDTFILMMGVTGLFVPQDTVDVLYVDGIHYDLVPGSDMFDFSSALGPIFPASPFTIALSGSFVSNTTIPVSNIHWIELNADYDTDEDSSIFGGSLPAGFTLWGYIPETNVSVTGVGTPNVVVDPLGDPDPLDSIVSVWVNLTAGQGAPDNTAPLVSNVMLNDQPSLTYGLSNVPSVVYLNATVDDTGRGDMSIGGANYTIGAQNWPGTDMNPSDGAFNQITEDVTITIVPPTVTTGYCVYGWDIVPNFDTVGACATITVLDDIAPQINNILIDGVPFATYFLSTAPATVPLNATVDDGPTGGSLIDGANYTIQSVDNWPGLPMIAVDGGFADIWEDITADVPVPTSAGTYDYFVHAWDEWLNYNDSAPSVRITVIDDVEPDVTGVLLNGQPTYISVMPGTIVIVEATIDDSAGRGDTPIQGANYTIDGNWLTSTPLDALDGTYDEATEPVVSSVANSIDTTLLAEKDYLVCAYGWDDVPNYNVAGECATLNISSVDDKPPFVLNVLLNDQPTLDVYPGDMVYLNATIDDTPALQSNIGGANYTIGAQNWPGTPMFPFDGTFDQPTEDVNVSFDTTGWTVQPYQICVYGWDEALNNNTTGACATLNVQAPPDTQPPTILNLEATPDPQAPDVNVEISADVTDNVGVDEVWINIADPDGNNVGNYTMSPGTGDEYSYENDFPAEGRYTYTIWANDTSNNWASASGSFDIQELTPPTIDVVVDPEYPDVGETVTFEASVADDSGVDRVRIVITDSEGNDVLSNRSMDDLGGGVYEYEFSFDEAGDYDYTISARDEKGNWNEVVGSITATSVAGPSFFEEYWWLILIIIIVVIVVVLAALLMRRRPKPVEEPVAEEAVAVLPSTEAAPPEAPPAPPEEPMAPPPEEGIAPSPPEGVESEELEDVEG